MKDGKPEVFWRRPKNYWVRGHNTSAKARLMVWSASMNYNEPQFQTFDEALTFARRAKNRDDEQRVFRHVYAMLYRADSAIAVDSVRRLVLTMIIAREHYREGK